MGTDYVMKGWDILYNKEVEWISKGKPDTDGSSSGVNPANLTGIRVFKTISTPTVLNTVALNTADLNTAQILSNNPASSADNSLLSSQSTNNNSFKNKTKNKKRKIRNSSEDEDYQDSENIQEQEDDSDENNDGLQDIISVNNQSSFNFKKLIGIAVSDSGLQNASQLMRKSGSNKSTPALIWLKDQNAWSFCELDNSGFSDQLSIYAKSLLLPNDGEIKAKGFQIKGSVSLIKPDKQNRVQVGSLNNPVYLRGYQIIDNYIAQSDNGRTSETSQTGFIRLLNETVGMSFRNKSNTDDALIIASDSCDQIHIGDNKNRGIIYNTGGAHIFSIDNNIILGVINSGLAFNSHIDNPTIQQKEQTNGSNGNNLTIKAQSAFAKNSIGGSLVLESGKGVTDGTVDIKTGNELKIRIYPSNYNNQNNNSEMISQRNSSNTNSNSILLFSNTLRFNNNNSFSRIRFDSINLENQKANRLSIEGQRNIGADGIGGDIYLSSGAGKKDSGSIVLQSGGIDKVSINQNTSIFNNKIFHDFKIGDVSNVKIVKDKFITNRGRRRKVEVVDCDKGDYQIDECDDIIAVFPTREVNIFLPKNAELGDTYDIKDAGGSSCLHNIIINGNGKYIDGDDTLILNDDYCSVTLIYNGRHWNII